jgi:hypothetical protein
MTSIYVKFRHLTSNDVNRRKKKSILAALYMLDIANGPSLAEKKSKKLF